MPIQFDNFDQNKIDRLKTHLSNMAEKQKGKFYEIFVDNLKAVPKTDEISDFDAYEDYMTVDTEQIKIVIYNSTLSPRNDQYVFILKAKTREDAQTFGLSGLPFAKFSKRSISDWRKTNHERSEQEIEIRSLKSEIRELEQTIEEKENIIHQQNQIIEQAKRNGNKIAGYHIGDIASVAMEGLVKSAMDGKFPILNGLMGIKRDTTNPALGTVNPSTENAEVSFESVKENAETSNSLSELDQNLLTIIKQVHAHFTEEEFNQILDVLDLFANDKTLIAKYLEPVKE